MANLLTAVLDDVNRKRGDTYPITATLRANGVVANLTGATITVTLVDSATRVPLVLDGACTNVGGGALDATGRVQYQLTPTQLDVEGTYEVEFKEVLAGATQRFPCASYSELRIWAVLGYPATVPSSYNPGSIPAGTGVAGSLLWTPIAEPATPTTGVVEWIDSTTLLLTTKDSTGTKKTIGGSSIVNSGTANGRLLVPVQIDRQVLAAAGTVTTAAWAAGAYRKIIVDFKGSLSAANYIGLRANADATANYSHQFYLGTGTGSPVGVVCEAGVNQNRIGVSAIAGQGFSFHVEIDPRTDGRSRVGHSYSGSLDPAAVANSYGTTGDFSWNNTATDLTFLTLIQYGIGASTITGELVVSGIPA